ncbi:MAG: pyridoxamine 5'-phosphate oxidase family protein [Roseiflexaceae bacterium]
MNAEVLATVATLIRSQRVAALGTRRDDIPFVSMVAYAIEPGFDGLLLHLSQLAAHTRQLLADSQSSLLICDPDDGRDDVQTLARITIVGAATPIPTGSDSYAAARACYLARLPAAEMLFNFPDFRLFRFIPSEARYIGGFARAYTLTAEQLRIKS